MTDLAIRHSARWWVSWLLIGSALICVPFAHLGIVTLDPWLELGRLASGLWPPDLASLRQFGPAILQTLAFGLLGVAVGSVAGFGLALVFHWRWVRILCASIRAVHELFWALIFLQIFGLHPLTGLLAIALPYTGTFAKVYAEILEEGDQRSFQLIKRHSSWLSAFFYSRVPDVWKHIKTYTAYRLECGLRSSAVLGFVGLPTLGYHLSSAFMQGEYAQVWALLIVFYVLIATIPYWLRPSLLPLYLLLAPFLIRNDSEIRFENVQRFFTQDIIPSPLLKGEGFEGLWTWMGHLWTTQAWPGLVDTLLLSQMALVLTGIVALVLFPLVSRAFLGTAGRGIGHGVLIVMRSTPEYIIAFILLLLWGPSMLPAVVALALHNGAIIGHLVGRYSHALPLRPDGPHGLNLYAYEVLPRSYRQFLAFLFYRWEIIIRETAILGILGITTLGFYIDSAIQSVRLDRAIFLILVTALLNITVDAIARRIRQRMRLNATMDCR